MAIDNDVLQRMKAKDPSLVELDLTRVDIRAINNSERETLLEFLASPHNLEKLILDYSPLDKEAKQVLTTIAQHPGLSLRMLSLENCLLGPADADVIKEILDKHRLDNLNLIFNNFGDGGVRKIVAPLYDDDSLQILNLGSNEMTGVGIEYVAQMIENNNTLKEVYLLGNDINEKSVQRMLGALKINNTLTHCEFVSPKVGLNWRDLKTQAEAYLVKSSNSHEMK